MLANSSELADLLSQPEGQRLAYVRRAFRVDELAETLAALANAHGGAIIVGVSGRGKKIEGVADVESARLAALDAALACTPPLVLPLPAAAPHGDTALLLLEVPSGLPHVYSVHGKYLRRAGAANQPIPPDALRKLLIERGETSWERMAPAGATLDDLDPNKLSAYVQRSGPAAAGDPLTFLFRRGCVAKSPLPIVRGQWQGDLASRLPATDDGRRATDYVPTNAGLLLFGRDVERFFPQCEVTLVRYRGREMGDEFLREDIRDTLVETVRRAEIWISEHMRRGSRMVGLERQDWAQFPQGALREALVNAVAHRDYTIRGEGIRIALFGDRMECYSPGRLPGHVTVENIAAERFSRNETLVQVLSDYGLIERLGYGIDRMLRQMADAALPPPEFRETAAGFLVMLRGQAGEDRNDVAAIDTSEWRRMGLNERQISSLLHLAEQRRITNSDIQELAPDVSPETIRRDLADLVARGLLLKIGEKRGAYYILK